MAKILLRGSFNEDGYCGAVADPSDRETAARKLLREAGLEAEAFYYSPTAFCHFVIMEGDVSDLAAAEFAFMSSGEFKSAEAHLLITRRDECRPKTGRPYCLKLRRAES